MRCFALCAAALGWVLLALGPPCLLIATALWQGSEGVFPSGRSLDLLGSSVLMAGGAAMLASILGVPLGFLLALYAVPARRLLIGALCLPLLLPRYLLASCAVYFLGQESLLGQLVEGVVPAGTSPVYGPWGVVVVQGIGLYPIVLLSVTASLYRAAPSEWDAFRIQLGPTQAWRAMLWRHGSAIASGGLIAFVFALLDFVTPTFLQTRTYMESVVAQFSAFMDPPGAVRRAIPLMLAAFVAVGMALLLAARNRAGVVSRVMAPVPSSIGIWRWPVFLGVLGLTATVSVVPFAATALRMERMAVVAESAASCAPEIWASTKYAFLAATGSVVLAFLLAEALPRRRGVRVWLTGLSASLTVGIPASVMGISLIHFYNTTIWPSCILQSGMVLVLAQAARFGPLALLMLLLARWSRPASFEEASWLSGRSWLRTLARPVLGAEMGHLVLCWLIVFALSVGEAEAAVLLVPPGATTVPIRIMTLVHYGLDDTMGALCLIQAVLVLIPAALAVWILERKFTSHVAVR